MHYRAQEDNLTCCRRRFGRREYLEEAAHEAVMVRTPPSAISCPSWRPPRRIDHVGVAVARGLDAALDLRLQQRLVPPLRPRAPRLCGRRRRCCRRGWRGCRRCRGRGRCRGGHVLLQVVQVADSVQEAEAHLTLTEEHRTVCNA